MMNAKIKEDVLYRYSDFVDCFESILKGLYGKEVACLKNLKAYQSLEAFDKTDEITICVVLDKQDVPVYINADVSLTRGLLKEHYLKANSFVLKQKREGVDPILGLDVDGEDENEDDFLEKNRFLVFSESDYRYLVLSFGTCSENSALKSELEFKCKAVEAMLIAVLNPLYNRILV